MIDFMIIVRFLSITKEIKNPFLIEIIADIIETKTDESNIKPPPKRKKANMPQSKSKSLISKAFRKPYELEMGCNNRDLDKDSNNTWRLTSTSRRPTYSKLTCNA